MSIIQALFLVAAAAFPAEEEEKPAQGKPPIRLDDIVVTATRKPESSLDVPYFVDAITEEDIRQRKLSRTLPESLSETPGVMVQKTGYGQGSPYIRGFTGFRTLLLLDGIRLNNSVFRDGPNQYWNTVDPLTVGRLEVVKGPGSVLYGSDAVGGTVNAITRSRESNGDGFVWDRRLYYRFASAERSHVGRAEVSGGLDQEFSFLAGASLKDFDDLRGGGDVGLQRKTGYEELDGDFKLEYFPDADSKLIIAHQRVNLDDAWRAHKTVFGVSWEGTTVGDEKKRVLDQDRDLTYLRYHWERPNGFMDRMQASLSYQVQREDQFRVRSDDRSDKQGFDVGTFGASVQFESPSPIGHWTYGVEFYRDHVDSYRINYQADGTLDAVSIQGPVADDAMYDLLGAYLQDEIPLSDRTDLILGTRYTYARADADSVEDPVTGGEISISDRWANVVGSARLLYDLDGEDRWKLFTGVSQGFRAPNLSDLTRLDTARSNEIETPSPDLDPERYLAYEVGLKAGLDDWSAQCAYYYTDIQDMIVRTPTGNIIDGDAEVTKKNAGDGYVQGVEVGASYRFRPQWTAFASATWMDGEVDGYPTSSVEKKKEPISRLMPATVDLGLRWKEAEDRFWIEGILTLADEQDDLSASDEADTQRIPPGGTPGYHVLTLRGGWRAGKDLVLSAALENITNEDYRIHGSGQNEPGRNLVLSASWRF